MNEFGPALQPLGVNDKPALPTRIDVRASGMKITHTYRIIYIKLSDHIITHHTTSYRTIAVRHVDREAGKHGATLKQTNDISKHLTKSEG